MSPEELEDVAALKKHLCDSYGFPVYLQQLVHDSSVLADEIKLVACMDLQLVILRVSDETRERAEEQLMSAARVNHIKLAPLLLLGIMFYFLIMQLKGEYDSCSGVFLESNLRG